MYICNSRFKSCNTMLMYKCVNTHKYTYIHAHEYVHIHKFQKPQDINFTATHMYVRINVCAYPRLGNIRCGALLS